MFIAEKFISQCISWSARLKYFNTLKGLQSCIINVYDDISFIAIKGIKSFIQILNPKI